MTMRRVKLLCTALMLLASHGALAVSYPLPPEGSRLVGSAFTIAVPDNNTQPLESFAAQYGRGLSNMLEANPGVDVYLPHSGSTLTIPQQLILPDTVREGSSSTSPRCVSIITRRWAIASKSCQSALVRRDAKRRVTG